MTILLFRPEFKYNSTIAVAANIGISIYTKINLITRHEITNNNMTILLFICSAGLRGHASTSLFAVLK